MKNIMFFITHATLDIELADYVFKSIAQQSIDYQFFDVLYIYNTHQHELPNDELIKLYDKYELNRWFKGVELFEYDNNTPKKLSSDVGAIRQYCIENYDSSDRVFISKSDICLSKNLFRELSGLTKNPVAFITPFVCAKKRVPKDEIIEYCQREKFIESDEITFYTESENGTEDSDFNRRPNVSIFDEQMRFFSCRVIKIGFVPLYCDIGLLNLIHLQNLDWGGIEYRALVPYYVRAYDSFIVHMYHDIISENRSGDREGPVGAWLNS